MVGAKGGRDKSRAAPPVAVSMAIAVTAGLASLILTGSTSVSVAVGALGFSLAYLAGLCLLAAGVAGRRSLDA